MTIQILISIFASVTYGSVLLIVALSKPLNKMRRYFLLYLAAMLIVSFSSFLIFIEIGGTLWWFRCLIAGGIISMIGLFQFVQTWFARNRSWTYLLFWYGLLAVVISLSTDLVVRSAYLESGYLVYDFHPLIGLIAGPVYVLSIFNLVELVRGYRESDTDLQRMRLRYLILALSLILSVSMVNWTELGKYPIDIAGNGIAALLIAYAILRHSLLDIRVVVRTGLLYSLVTVFTTAIYFLLFSFALSALESYAGGRILLFSVVVAIMTSVVLAPLREKTQEWIDRFFYRTKYDASLMLERLSETTATLMEVEDITDIILDEIMQTMKVVHISFFIKYPVREVYQLVSYRGVAIGSVNEMDANHPIIHWLGQNHQVLTSRELLINPIFKSLWGIERHLIGDRNIELFIPLVAGQELVGFFGVGLKRSGQPYTLDDQRILMTAANQTAIAVKNARLYDQLQETFVQTVVTLANAIDVRDTYTSDHSQRIANLAMETAKIMGCDAEMTQDVYWGGLLHDIGKIGIPDAILLKPGPLDEDEWAVIRTHPDIGADLIQPISQLARVAPIIRYSHERFDGSGYPHGIKGEKIPIGARVVAVVDAFSAMMDQRVYKDANSLQETIDELNLNAGTQFDPQVVAAFLQVLAESHGWDQPSKLYQPTPEKV